MQNKKIWQKNIAIAMRIAFVIITLYFAFLKEWKIVAAGIVPFLVTIPLFYMGSKDKRYFTFDWMIIVLFCFNSLQYFMGYWTFNPLFGWDKALHLGAGLWLGYLGSVVFERQLKKSYIAVLILVLGVVGVGGIWEMFEYVLAMLPSEVAITKPWYDDTIVDMVAVMIGGFATAWFNMRNKS